MLNITGEEEEEQWRTAGLRGGVLIPAPVAVSKTKLMPLTHSVQAKSFKNQVEVKPVLFDLA